MIIKKLTSGKVNVIGADGVKVSMKKNSTLVVTEMMGKTLLNVQGGQRKVVETQGEVDKRLEKEIKALQKENKELKENQSTGDEGVALAELQKAHAEVVAEYEAEIVELKEKNTAQETTISMLKDETEGLKVMIAESEKESAIGETVVSDAEVESEKEEGEKEAEKEETTGE
ncbi:MAG: hypothetical protein ACPG5V_00730 [Vibrio cyclitrophicus]